MNRKIDSWKLIENPEFDPHWCEIHIGQRQCFIQCEKWTTEAM